MDSERISLQHGSEEKGPCSINTPLEKRLLFILVIVIIVGIGLCIAVAANSRDAQLKLLNHSFNLCLSQQCITTASKLMNSMDFAQKPCDDFYSFVCGNWISNSILPGELNTQFTRLNKIINLRIKGLLETDRADLAEHENKTRAFYKACMDTDTRDEESKRILIEDLETFGGWPLINDDWDAAQFNWSDLMVKLLKNGYPNNMLFSLTVDLDIKNTTSSVITVSWPTLGLSEKSHYLLSKDDKFILGYKELILDLARHLQPNLNITSAKRDLERAIEVEKTIAKATTGHVVTSKPTEYYNVKTLKEVEKFAPKIPWRYLLQRLLPPKEDLRDDQKVIVTSPAYLLMLNELLEDLEKAEKQRDLANYMLYRAVLFASIHIDKEMFFLSRYRLHQSLKHEMWQECAETTAQIFHMSVAARYAEKYLDDDSRSQLEMMFQEIQASILEDIKQAKWLDAETREKALLKVKKTRSLVAYRDEILDEQKMNDYYKEIEVGSVHFSNLKAALAARMKQRMQGLNERRARFRWSDMTSVLTANAFYQSNQNAIVIPIGILQDTFFASGRPNYINYGGLGAIVGHEFTHAFDSTGSLFDENGNFKTWWSSESWEKFTEKEECYIKQYEDYYDEKVNRHVNGNITLSENIADNGGLQAAFEAYSRVLDGIGWEKQLPGLKYTERQMFWIAFASVWCRKQTDHSLEITMEKSVHAPSKYRVNGALSNMKEFSEDFQCGEGSRMNPTSKCSLWR